MRDLNVNEMNEVSGGWVVPVVKEAAKAIAAGVFYDGVKSAMKDIYPGPITPTSKGQMGRNN